MITALLIILQIVWIIATFSYLAEYSAITEAFFTILSLAMFLYIVKKDEKSAYKIGWIVLILLLPLFGGIFYLIFGDKKPAKKLRNKMNEQHQRLIKFLPGENAPFPVKGENKIQSKRIADTAAYLRMASDYPLYSSHADDCKYYPLGEDIFSDMLNEMEKAEHFIFMEYFIIDKGYMWDRVFDVMKRKAKQGVDVRLIYDDMGSLFLLPLEFSYEVEKLGIKFISFSISEEISRGFLNNDPISS